MSHAFIYSTVTARISGAGHDAGTAGFGEGPDPDACEDCKERGKRYATAEAISACYKSYSQWGEELNSAGQIKCNSHRSVADLCREDLREDRAVSREVAGPDSNHE